MATKKQGVTKNGKEITPQSRSLPIAERGIKTDSQFAELMSALMSDLICKAISPDIGNATCNAGGKLLKMVEMKHKYGQAQSNGERVLLLA